jgi:membrane protein YdbS with pleckstrin-like domain
MILRMVIRQSAKLILVGYIFFILVEIGIAIVWFATKLHPDIPYWAPMILPAVLLVFLAIRHIQRTSTRLKVEGERLRYEAGIFSKTTRTIELAKVQDVRVDQTLFQRMLNVGNLSVETAGSSSRIEIPSIDKPNEASSHVLDLAKIQRSHQV